MKAVRKGSAWVIHIDDIRNYQKSYLNRLISNIDSEVISLARLTRICLVLASYEEGPCHRRRRVFRVTPLRSAHSIRLPCHLFG